jgi:mobilome CxxCx(11)CxxC protein
MRTPESDVICLDCWNRAIYAYGTGAVFQKRAKRYGGYIRFLAFMGIVVPALIGGVVIGFGADASYLKLILGAAAAVALIQLFFSVWALSYKWDDKLSYSQESATDNMALASAFEELGKLGANPPPDLDVRYVVVKTKDEARRTSDTKQAVSDKELIFAHRTGLRQYQRPCVECKKIPQSMESTDCPICGRF